jgi:hypothetical protein
MTVRGNDQIAGCAIFVCPMQSDPRCCMVFRFGQSSTYSFVVSGDQSLISCNHRLN